jgi:hypothetical protein
MDTVITILIVLLILFILSICIYWFKKHIKENIDFEMTNTLKPNNSKYTAVIVEPRKHKALEYVLNNFLENLNSDWNFIIFHGTKNKEYIQNIIDTKLLKHKNRIQLINLNIDNLSSSKAYSELFYNKEFYKYIPTEVFLVFQTDTVICSKYKDLINNFIKYDYVGAPWSFIFNKEGSYEIGNGGLSLRRKSKMLEIIDKCDFNNIENEDIVFSKLGLNGCDDTIVFKPSGEEAKEFSIETIYNDKSFGIHNAYGHHSVNKFSSWCPEAIEVQKLNS